MSKLQRGFTIIETLIGLVVIAALIGGGWYVWHKNHKTKASTVASSSTSASSPVAQVQKPDLTKLDGYHDGYFYIKNWGVRAPYSGSMTLSYFYTPTSKGEEIAFSAKQLDDLVSGSSDSCKGYGGLIDRLLPGDSADAAGDTASVFYAKNRSDPKITIVHLGSYYYVFGHAQSACAGTLPSTLSTANQAKEAEFLSEANNAVESLVQKLQLTPSS